MVASRETGVTIAFATQLSIQLERCWEMGRTGRSVDGAAEARRLLELARVQGGDRDVAMALTCCGFFCLQLGHADEGLKFITEGRRLFALVKDARGEALAGSIHGWLLCELGLSDLGFEVASEAVIAANSTTDLGLRAFAMSCKAITLMMCRQDQIAQPLLADALELAEEAGDVSTIARCNICVGYSLASLAELADADGDLERGRELREQCTLFNDRGIEAARRYGDIWNLRTALCNGAENHAVMGQLDLADGYLKEWEALKAPIGLREETHYLYTKGEVLTLMKRHTEALEVCRKAADRAAKGPSLDNRSNTLKRLSDAEAAMGDFESALRHYRAYHDAFVFQMGELTRRRAHVAEMELQNERLRERAARLEAEARQDALTGIGNRRAFESDFAALSKRDFAIIVLDLDRFKAVNDQYSHIVGDAVLVLAAGLLGGVEGARAYRLGGEEFALLVPGADCVAAINVAETVRLLIADTNWSDVAPGLSVTASFGVVSSTVCRDAAMLAEVDRRLYAAKAAGRNLVVGRPVGLEAPAAAAS